MSNSESFIEAGRLVASELTPSSAIAGDDEVDTGRLRVMALEAEAYASSFVWCGSVLESFFADGFGGIFAIFFLRIVPSRPEVDAWIWIVVGDVPPAYLPLTDCESAAQVYRTYMQGMSRWVEMARKGVEGTPDDGVPPVNLPATREGAERVEKKLIGLSMTVGCLFEGEE